MQPKIVLELDQLRSLESGIGRFSLYLSEAVVLEAERRGLALYAMSHGECFDLLPPQARLLPLPCERRRWWRRLFRSFRETRALWHISNQHACCWPTHRDTPVLLTIHDIDFIRLTPQETWPARFKDMQRKIDRSAAVAVISEAVAEDVRTRLDLRGKPLRVIYNGGPPRADVRPEPVPELVGKPFLVSVAVFMEKKNFLALAAMMEHLPDFTLVLAGRDDDPYAQILRDRIASMPWRDRVLILGRVSDGVRQWLNENCAATLFAAYAEGFGLPALEGINAGRPTILAHRTSLPEVGGPEGFYWHDFEPASMAKVVRESLAAAAADPDRVRRIQARAAQFRWSEAARRYVDWYEELLDAAFPSSASRRRAA